MEPVIVRNIEIGTGIPKICAPVVGATKEEIICEAEKIKRSPVDIAEWRTDWFEASDDIEAVKGILCRLRDVLGEMPVLFTFRTLKEGGKKAIDRESYIRLNIEAAQTGCVDLIDAELFFAEEEIKNIIHQAHRCGVKVVASSHDFEKTPDAEEIVSRLCKMQELGADLLKIAVMPQSEKDVLALLQATDEMHQKYAKRPVITMSMSGIGTVSRLCGEVFGSAVTFGAVGKASAPGQIGAEELAQILAVLHKGI